MTSWPDGLSDRQRLLLERWLPGACVVTDHSWGQVATTVLEVAHEGARLIVKAGGEGDHHIERELHAHRHWLGPWTAIGRAPALVHGDAEARLLVTQYLPGRLVLGGDHADDPAIFHQAGELLALFHGQSVSADDDYERRENDKALAWLSGAHRIGAPAAERLREQIEGWPTPSAVLTPTHGDWQPRNWLLDDDKVVRIIDFGRAAMRAPLTDFGRLAVQDFRRDARLEAAFLAGYGSDPVTMRRGTAAGFARRSVPRAGLTGSATSSLRRKDSG